jgi:hypothetical protein
MPNQDELNKIMAKKFALITAYSGGSKYIKMPALVPESEWYKELYAVVDEIQDFEVAEPKVPGVDCLF